MVKKINIVLVGKTGNGKSSTGNTILQKNAFEELLSAIGDTEMLSLRKVSMDDTFKLCVYDTPGIMSLRFGENDRRGSIRKEMDRLMSLAKEVHVFIFVFKFNSRFTQEEAETVKDLKGMFGENFLKDHGIVVITHGDLCDSKAIEQGKTSQDLFDHWCMGAGHDFDQLVSEVKENNLLVNNQGDFSTSSQRLKSSQDLRKMIKHMFEKGSSFTKQDFDRINKPCTIL